MSPSDPPQNRKPLYDGLHPDSPSKEQRTSSLNVFSNAEAAPHIAHLTSSPTLDVDISTSETLCSNDEGQQTPTSQGQHSSFGLDPLFDTTPEPGQDDGAITEEPHQDFPNENRFDFMFGPDHQEWYNPDELAYLRSLQGPMASNGVDAEADEWLAAQDSEGPLQAALQHAGLAEPKEERVWDVMTIGAGLTEHKEEGVWDVMAFGVPNQKITNIDSGMEMERDVSRREKRKAEALEQSPASKRTRAAIETQDNTDNVKIEQQEESPKPKLHWRERLALSDMRIKAALAESAIEIQGNTENVEIEQQEESPEPKLHWRERLARSEMRTKAAIAEIKAMQKHRDEELQELNLRLRLHQWKHAGRPLQLQPHQAIAHQHQSSGYFLNQQTPEQHFQRQQEARVTQQLALQQQHQIARQSQQSQQLQQYQQYQQPHLSTQQQHEQVTHGQLPAHPPSQHFPPPRQFLDQPAVTQKKRSLPTQQEKTPKKRRTLVPLSDIGQEDIAKMSVEELSRHKKRVKEKERRDREKARKAAEKEAKDQQAAMQQGR